MENVRFNIFDDKYRFKPFTVKDYRDLLLVRAELEDDDKALDDLLEYLFSDIDINYRPLAFMKRLIASIGKDKLKMRFKCSKCEKEKMFIFNIETKHVDYVEYTVPKTNIKLKVKPSLLNTEQDSFEFLDNIYEVSTDLSIKWTDLSKSDKDQIYNALDLHDINSIKEKSLIKYSYNTKCCESKSVNIYNFLDMYKILFTIDEIFDFYKTNRILNTKGYSNNDLMNMLYVERSIALSLILSEGRK